MPPPTSPPTPRRYGFGLAETPDGGLLIHKISSNIYNWGLLQVGDKVRSVGGVSTEGMAHSKAVAMINETLRIELGIEREDTLTSLGSTTTTVSQRGSVTLNFPPGLLISKLNMLKQEQEHGGIAAHPDIARPAPAAEEGASRESLPGSIASIIAANI